MVVLVQYDIEIIGNFITIFFNHLNQLADGFIQVPVFVFSGFKYILNGNIIGQFIVSQQFAVPVIDIASGAGNVSFLSYFQFEIVHVFRAMYNLQCKDSVNECSAQQTEDYDQNKKPGRNQVQKPFLKVFKQIFLHSFFHVLPVSGPFSESADT